MAQVLFCLLVIFEVGMLVTPLLSETRLRALWVWFVNVLATGAASLTIKEQYPSWIEPQWHQGTPWAVIAWLMFISGLIIAVCKPRKHNPPVV